MDKKKHKENLYISGLYRSSGYAKIAETRELSVSKVNIHTPTYNVGNETVIRLRSPFLASPFYFIRHAILAHTSTRIKHIYTRDKTICWSGTSYHML